MKKIKPVSKFSVLIAISSFVLLGQAAHAYENTTDQTKDKVDEAKTQDHKATRKLKKQVRDASGNGSTVKDARDGASNLSDDASDKVKSAGRTTKDTVQEKTGN